MFGIHVMHKVSNPSQDGAEVDLFDRPLPLSTASDHNRAQSPQMAELDDLIEAADPALAAYAAPHPGPGRFEQSDGVRGFVLETVYEGYLMHYGEPRAFTGMDADLRLLAGDALYALGLARLAESGDLEAVAVLSDLIAASAQAQAEGRPEDAEALWESSSDSLVGLSPPGSPR